MFENTTYLYWLIVICEVSFWIFLALGLAARYLLRRNRLSKFLLLSLPVIDLLLIAFTAADLKAGAPPTLAHGLAAAYVGFTVAFGSIAVRWADQHFAHWVGEGPAPTSGQTRGWEAVVYDLSLWLGSTPFPRTLQNSLMMRQEECHGESKEVQRRVQA